MSCDSPLDDLMEEDSISYHAVIWDNGMHNAFTDLIEFDGTYYCCFREGYSHVPVSKYEYGKIRVLSSQDGINWQECFIISDENYDLRDPHMCITPDKKLMINFGCSSFISGAYESRKTMVCFFDAKDLINGKIENIKPLDVNFIDFGKYKSAWLWKVSWYEGVAYGVVEGINGPIFVTSNDGINFYLKFKINLAEGGGETDISFYPDGRMLLAIRVNYGNGYFGLSYPPYDDIDWKESPFLIQCPEILRIGDSFLIGSRSENGTAVYHYRDGEIERLINIQGGYGDCAYPGMIRVGNELWMSYYIYENNCKIKLLKYDITNLLIGSVF